jgi:hypothetical protein
MLRYYLLMQTTNTPAASPEPTERVSEHIPSACSLSSEHHSRFCPTCSSRLEDSR